MTTLEKLRSLAESLNSPQSKRRDTMAGVLYEARREVVGILAEMEVEAAARASLKPLAWVIGRDNNANDRGFIDAMAWQEGEFSTPLYLLPEPPVLAVKMDRPFYGAECPSYPDCSGGCGLGCTKKIEAAVKTDGDRTS